MNLVVRAYSVMSDAIVEVSAYSSDGRLSHLAWRGRVPHEVWDAVELAGDLATVIEGLNRALDAVMAG